MDSITFKNFRQFKNETTFELKNINILVGKNNSGKSTLTKGLRLYLYNIKNLTVNTNNIFSYEPFFQFGGNALDNPHVGTFGRAFSKDSEDDYISFSMHLGHILIETIVSRYYQDVNGNQIDCFNKTSAPISRITIFDDNMASRYIFDFEKKIQTIEIDAGENSICYRAWKREIEEIQRNPELFFKKHGVEHYVYPPDKERVERLQQYLAIKHKELIKLEMSLVPEEFNGPLYSTLLTCALQNYLNDQHLQENEEEKGHLLYELAYNDKDGNNTVDDFHFLSDVIGKTEHDIRHIIDFLRIEYIEAHSVTRSIVYNGSDKNDYMAQTILDYLNENIKTDDPEKAFIEDWMMKFEIGEDFEIESIGGECFKLGIIEDVDHPEEITPLLDKGVGSNQMMILLLQLATIMHKNRGATAPPMIIIEEPEQNLHPQMQSFLADLFADVYAYPRKTNKNSCGISFLIETHSEYLVRKSQVRAKDYVKNGGDINSFAFRTYYFPSSNDVKRKPYDMKYCEDGRFYEKFGYGFFDEAAELAMQIF